MPAPHPERTLCARIIYPSYQEELLLHADSCGWDRFADIYCRAVRSLEAAGTDAFAICASLVHRVADLMRVGIDVFLLHLADYAVVENWIGVWTLDC